jgi:hypothetical protein
MVGGMRYFGRMLDKIRLHERGELAQAYHKNLGRSLAADGRCLDFLRVKFEDLRERVLAGGTDEEILQWCFQNGRRLNDADLVIWNGFMSKFGWNDSATPTLERLKKENGIPERDDIKTIGELIDFEEKRRV